MSIWIIENGKLRPTYPECPYFNHAATHPNDICGGETQKIDFPPWQCGTMIQMTDGRMECCGDDVELQCQVCLMVACAPCMNKEWTNR